MRIRLSRTGGVSGVQLISELRSDLLPPEERQLLEQLVKESGFFDLPSVVEGSAQGPDRFEHTLTIDAGVRIHTVRIAEASAPPPLRALITWLSGAARRIADRGLRDAD